jgi:hypothetical protein
MLNEAKHLLLVEVVIPNFFAWREDFTLLFRAQRGICFSKPGAQGLGPHGSETLPGRPGREGRATSCGSHQADVEGIKDSQGRERRPPAYIVIPIV